MTARSETMDVETETGADVAASGGQEAFRTQQIVFGGDLQVVFRTHHELNGQSGSFRHRRIIAETSATMEPMRSEEGRN